MLQGRLRGILECARVALKAFRVPTETAWVDPCNQAKWRGLVASIAPESFFGEFIPSDGLLLNGC